MDAVTQCLILTLLVIVISLFVTGAVRIERRKP